MTRPVALKRLVQFIAGQSPPSDDVGDYDGEGLPFLQGNAEFGPIHPLAVHRCDSASRRCTTGDILLSIRAPVGALNKADRSYGIGRGLCAVRAGNVDPRFLWWLLHAEANLLLSIAVGSTYDAVTSEDIGSLRVSVPVLTTQRAIADYLDTETARIDALIEKKRRVVDLLYQHASAACEQRIRGLVDTYGSTPLKFVVRRVEVGIVITPSAWYSDEGVLALRGLNVTPGRIDLKDVVRITDEGHQLHQKSALRTGDVVVVRTGQAGAAAVVPPDLDGCNCIDLVIVRPSPKVLPAFLEFVLNSDWTQKHVEEYSVGTIQSHFNVGAMKQVPIPVPPLDEQHRVVQHLRTVETGVDSLTQLLCEQIDLLTEHRQALITAAVTGELPIARVAA